MGQLKHRINPQTPRCCHTCDSTNGHITNGRPTRQCKSTREVEEELPNGLNRRCPCTVYRSLARLSLYHVRFTTRSVKTSNALFASLSGNITSTSRAFSAWVRARSRVRATPEDRRTRSRACGGSVMFIEHLSSNVQWTYKFNVAVLAELPLDERTHLGVFLPSKQSGSCGETKLQVSPSRFAQCSLPGFVVKNVVHKLEGHR